MSLIAAGIGWILIGAGFGLILRDALNHCIDSAPLGISLLAGGGLITAAVWL